MKRVFRSLFGVIFVWFCLTLMLGVVGNVFIVDALAGRHVNIQKHPIVFHAFSFGQRMALDTFERHGPEGVLSIIKDRGWDHHMIFFFDGTGRELTGRPVPPPMDDEFFKRVNEKVEPNESGYDFFVVEPFLVGTKEKPDGGRLILAVEMPRLPPPGMFLFSSLLWKRLGPVLLVGVLLSYLLARHLTQPVRRLQTAARRIAGGDLKHRIGSDMGKSYDEINALAADFDRMAGRVDQLVSSQRRLLRDISHELRSPLTRMNVALELARQRTGDTAKAELDRIELDAGRLDDLIGQMLAFLRLEHMQEYPDTSPINLGALLMSIVRDTDVESQVKGVTVTVRNEAAAMVEAAPELLRRALENVLRNAIHYTPSGKNVTVTLDKFGAGEEAVAVVTIRDMGPGVPDESLDKLFMPYYRVDSCRKRRTGGSGIGLAIAHRAITLHGGSIIARNEPLGGLAVIIRLPASG